MAALDVTFLKPYALHLVVELNHFTLNPRSTQVPTRASGRAILAQCAAELAEYADETIGQFWPVHDALIKHEPT